MAKRRAALSPEARENRLISLAVDLAEKQLSEGTAPPSMIVHYLKLGSTREKAEKEKLQMEVDHLRAKTKVLQSVENSDVMFKKAIKAFSTYSGRGEYEDEDPEIF